jgi:hypothetical protein
MLAPHDVTTKAARKLGAQMLRLSDRLRGNPDAQEGRYAPMDNTYTLRWGLLFTGSDSMMRDRR